MATLRTLTGNLADIFGVEVGARSVTAEVMTNIPPPGALIDHTNKVVRLPKGRLDVDASGDWSIQLPDTSAADLNVTNLQYRLVVTATPIGARKSVTWDSGFFSLTADHNIADDGLLDAPALTASWRSAFTDDMEAVKNEAVAATTADRAAVAADRAYVEARVVDDLGTTDGQTKALIETPTSETARALSSSIVRTKKLHHVNVYDDFFNGQDSTDNPAIWADTNHLNSAGLAAWAAHIVAATDANGSRIITGTSPKVTWFGDSWIAQDPAILTAATQAEIPGAIVVVSGVSGNTSADLLARFDTDVPSDSDFVIFNEPGVNDAVYPFSDATMAANLEALAAKVHGIGAVPVFTGMVPLTVAPAGAQRAQTNMAAQVGDGGAFPGVPASYLPTRYPLLAKGYREPEIGSIGLGNGALAATTSGLFNTAFGGYGALLSNTTGSNNVAVGFHGLIYNTTGSSNVAVGHQALLSNTTASGNVAIGDGAAYANVTGAGLTAVGTGALRNSTANQNTAVGTSALFSVSSGPQNTAVGAIAGYAATTGTGNTVVGYGAGYVAAGNVANASTSASYQTFIGYQAGQANATQHNEVVAVGTNAIVGSYHTVAVGVGAAALHPASVALGQSATTTAANQLMIGDRDIESTRTGGGITLKSPDGTRYKVTVANGGALTVAAA